MKEEAGGISQRMLTDFLKSGQSTFLPLVSANEILMSSLSLCVYPSVSLSITNTHMCKVASSQAGRLVQVVCEDTDSWYSKKLRGSQEEANESKGEHKKV